MTVVIRDLQYLEHLESVHCQLQIMLVLVEISVVSRSVKNRSILLDDVNHVTVGIRIQ